MLDYTPIAAHQDSLHSREPRFDLALLHDV